MTPPPPAAASRHVRAEDRRRCSENNRRTTVVRRTRRASAALAQRRWARTARRDDPPLNCLRRRSRCRSRVAWPATTHVRWPRRWPGRRWHVAVLRRAPARPSRGVASASNSRSASTLRDSPARVHAVFSTTTTTREINQSKLKKLNDSMRNSRRTLSASYFSTAINVGTDNFCDE